MSSHDRLLDPAAEWASLVLGTLASAGVRDVVFSPGSRSTPFVLAAARDERLTLHEAIDERAASFFALGQARVTGRASLLLCTSGTAPAHYLPAVIEAELAYLPLLILSADRPLELVDCHAPQTIDQLHLYGGHVRAFVELGVADASPAALGGVRRRLAQAVFTTQFPEPGAVHLNVRARKPLEPHADDHPASREIRAVAARPLTQSFVPQRGLSADALQRLQDGLGRRGVMVVGPQPLSPSLTQRLPALARALGYLLCGEATSQLRAATADAARGDALLPVLDLLPTLPLDTILQIGPPPTTAAWEPFLARHAHVPRLVLAAHGWPDPRGDARVVVAGDLDRAIDQLMATHRTPDASWLRTMTELARRAERVFADGVSGFVEAAVVRAVAKQLPPGSLLMVGNSLAIRVLDEHALQLPDGVGVLHQRGANGIDGLIAGASGAASTGRATTLLVGDVSVLHDLGGLALGIHARAPLTVVVLNNAGGRIFEQLPIVTDGVTGGVDVNEHLFTTPHTRSFGGAAQLFGWRYASVDTVDTLATALAQAGPTPLLIDAHVAPSGAAPLLRAARARFSAEVQA